MAEIHKLFRYSCHENEDSAFLWHVACCTLEDDTRVYRVMFDGPAPCDMETLIYLPAGADDWRRLQEFQTNVRDAANVVGATCWEFRTACEELLTLDPWLANITSSLP